jgi:archaellin
MPAFDFTIRTNRTNRLEVLEEYYSNVTANSTNEDQFEETTTVEIQQIAVFLTNASFSENVDRANVTIIEEIGKEKRELLYKYTEKLI